MRKHNSFSLDKDIFDTGFINPPREYTARDHARLEDSRMRAIEQARLKQQAAKDAKKGRTFAGTFPGPVEASQTTPDKKAKPSKVGVALGSLAAAGALFLLARGDGGNEGKIARRDATAAEHQLEKGQENLRDKGLVDEEGNLLATNIAASTPEAQLPPSAVDTDPTESGVQAQP